MKKYIFILICGLLSHSLFAGNKIKYYFNRPVYTTVSTGVNAAYLNNCSADTLVAYLNRAQYSLDICQYDFEKTWSYNIDTLDTVFVPKVAAAIDSAYARGVKVRYIYEASNANTGLSLLDTTHIHTLGSPQGANYTIMHNKFVVIDAKSPHAATDAIVWTGCMNWYYEQFNWDYNNIVVVQDSALASAYTAEFNMMWGDTGIAPNTATSKFGMYKTDLGLHNFTIDGKQVELYFSPSDGTNTHILSTIATADKDLYFGMYTFTMSTDASQIMSRYGSGVYVSGIDDSWSDGYSPYSTFTSGLGSHFKVYNESTDTLFHNKYLIVDPSDSCSDPMVLTGSHNWSSSANTHNDENTLIIHDASAANQYYQYFKATFNMLGGSLTPPALSCVFPTALPSTTEVAANAVLYPNPASGQVWLTYGLPAATEVAVSLTDMTGREMNQIASSRLQEAGRHQLCFNTPAAGIYMVVIRVGQATITKKLIVAQ